MGILATIAALFGSSCTKHDVHVEFIHGNDNTTIGVVDLPLEKLPDTFAVDTTFDIADKKWSVVRAEPVTKAEFARTCRLRVYVVPLTSMPPGELLYSLPTISDDIGEGEGSTPPDDTVFQIHEDDWRQIEFVAQTYKREMDLEFGDIRKVYDERKPSGGFVGVHIRKRIPSPLGDKAISLEELKRELPPKHEYKAVGVQRSLGAFKNSFAWDIDEDVTVWGTKDNRDRIRIICMTIRGNHHSAASFLTLAQFCAKRDLYLVNWCRIAKGSSAQEIQKLAEH
jgi:hypothetical protein